MSWRAYGIRLWVWARSWLLAPSPHFDSEFIKATEWALNYAPTGDEESYSSIAEFAQHQYNQSVSTYEGLDRKADELIRLTTTISGAILTAAATRYVAFHRPTFAYVALLPTAVSVFAAVRARTPGGAATPITPRGPTGRGRPWKKT